MATNTQQNTGKNTRPPVVVVLGHVDHGKTKLLDTIRKTKVAEGESGGITQHIGAYQVEVATSDKRQATTKITFLDTPGHEAFTAIRSRGAKVADIAILVVAADESVKPQTKEAIKIIKEEKIPFVVAINKIDKEGANVQKVKQDLAGEDVLVEDWGGQVPVIEISAKEGRNIKELLDMILLVAELEELTEDLESPGQGVIIESNLDKRRGYVATGLVQKGIVRLGDWITVGTVVGKIKSMEDFTGTSITEAKPSQPVLIMGWPEAADIGKNFLVAKSKSEAEKIAEGNIDLAPLFKFFKGQSAEDANKKLLNLVLKSDVSSSLEAIDAALMAIKSEEVGYHVVAYDIGNIGEADVQTATASRGQIVGFRVAVDASAKKAAEKEGVKISTFAIIYELIEYVRKEMAELLEPEIKRIPLGRLKILATFKKDARAQIVGGRVMSGKAVRGAMVDVFRNNLLLGTGKVGQLQHNKEDVPEVKEGLEAGIRFEPVGKPGSRSSDGDKVAKNISELSLLGKDFPEIKEGDMLEIYEEEKIKRSL